MNRSIPNVVLLVETSRQYGRSLLRGIFRYAKLHGPWQCHLTPGDFEQVVPKLRALKNVGVIARVETPHVARAILAAKLPTVALDLTGNEPIHDKRLAQLSEIVSDSRSAARLAAEHLLERGFQRFAFVGEPRRIWSVRREEGFKERLRAAFAEPIVYLLPTRPQDSQWEVEQSRLAEWLLALPKPIGIMACHDDRGRQVLEACRMAGVKVPEEAAVVGVDNDELLCEGADPPLSSVALNAETGGYRAAALLDSLMRGETEPPQRLVVEAAGVVVRRSTEALAINDPDVAAAMNFIHRHAAESIGIAEIVRETNVSRRYLETKFRKCLGRTPYEELQSVRINRAKQLLSETNSPSRASRPPPASAAAPISDKSSASTWGNRRRYTEMKVSCSCENSRFAAATPRPLDK